MTDIYDLCVWIHNWDSINIVIILLFINTYSTSSIQESFLEVLKSTRKVFKVRRLIKNNSALYYKMKKTFQVRTCGRSRFLLLFLKIIFPLYIMKLLGKFKNDLFKVPTYQQDTIFYQKVFYPKNSSHYFSTQKYIFILIKK